MSQQEINKEKTQSGKQVIFGILAFIIGIIVIAILVKVLFGL